MPVWSASWPQWGSSAPHSDELPEYGRKSEDNAYVNINKRVLQAIITSAEVQSESLGNNPREECNTRHVDMTLLHPITSNITVNIRDASCYSSIPYDLLHMRLNIHTQKPLQSQLPLFSSHFPTTWNSFTWRNECRHWSLPLINDLPRESSYQSRSADMLHMA